ncbi:GAP family protein, partial [Mycobacterium avium]|uniref:GAP family protein n=1 Tax=Mycobacterium avium TaxID=1764 RepID=UPI000578517B
DAPRRLGSRPAAMARPAQRLLNGDSLSVAGLAGLGIALPSVDYLAALAVIVASGAAAATQVGALLLFNVVAFALVEIPLLAYLVAPARTAASMTALHNWIRSRRRPQVAVLLAAAGCVFLTVGVTGL